jgi:hypothetical protein
LSDALTRQAAYEQIAPLAPGAGPDRFGEPIDLCIERALARGDAHVGRQARSLVKRELARGAKEDILIRLERTGAGRAGTHRRRLPVGIYRQIGLLRCPRSPV